MQCQHEKPRMNATVCFYMEGGALEIIATRAHLASPIRMRRCRAHMDVLLVERAHRSGRHLARRDARDVSQVASVSFRELFGLEQLSKANTLRSSSPQQADDNVKGFRLACSASFSAFRRSSSLCKVATSSVKATRFAAAAALARSA